MNSQSNIFLKLCRRVLLCISFSLLIITNAFAQGQDSTPADRDIMILGELLSGSFRNANQAYFDVRLKKPEAARHASVYANIAKIDAPKFGEMVFSSEHGGGAEGADPSYYLHVLEVDYEQAAVRMKNYALDGPASKRPKLKLGTYLEGCDLLWQQEAGQFRARTEAAACTRADFASEVQLTEDAMWFALADSNTSPYALDRARSFSCYVDVPGVGGGRDIPYERFQLEDMHDLGGEQWLTTKDGEEIGVSLFRVEWVMNNYEGVFTRPSFVIYANTKDEQGKKKEVGYAFTEPRAQRIGINLKWMLANCYMISNEDVTPFFKNNEPTL